MSGYLAALEKVANAARSYREEEASDTPRMWRGKKLQDLANELDDALEELRNEQLGKAGKPAPTVSDADDSGRC